MGNDLVISQEATAAVAQWQSPQMMKARMGRMQELMKSVMKKGTHFDTIQGCQKDSLFQPGSQLLSVTFCIGHEPQVEEIREHDEVRFRVTDRVFDQKTGITLGYGVGECSSMEDKYAWRRAVNDSEWENTPDDRRRIKYSKYNGKDTETKQVRTNPRDVANTVLKMARKRANVNGTIEVLAAGEIFTQDVEDMPEGMDLQEGQWSSGQRIEPPTAAPEEAPEEAQADKPDDDTRKKNGWISSKQEGFLHGKLEKAGVDWRGVRGWARVYFKNPNWELFMISWRDNAKIKGEKQMDYIIKVAEKEPRFFDKYAQPLQSAGNAPKPEAGNQTTSASTEQPNQAQAQNAAAQAEGSGPAHFEEFCIAIDETLSVMFPDQEQRDKFVREEIQKIGFDSLKRVPDNAFKTVIGHFSKIAAAAK